MFEIRTVTPAFAVSGQLSPADLAVAAARGFRSIVNNRPDGEEPGQPSSELLAAQAEQLGLAYHYLPVTPGQASDDQARKLACALAAAPGPVLAFCRSGTRSITLWALAQALDGGADSLVAVARSAGFDLEALRPRLEALAKAG